MSNNVPSGPSATNRVLLLFKSSTKLLIAAAARSSYSGMSSNQQHYVSIYDYPVLLPTKKINKKMHIER